MPSCRPKAKPTRLPARYATRSEGLRIAFAASGRPRAENEQPLFGKPAEKPAGETKESVEKEKPGTAKSTDGKTGDTAVDRKSGGAKVEPQQIQKVKTYFTAHKPNVKRVDRSAVSVSIGIAVPGSIGLYALPPDVVVASGDCPLEYFVWGEDVVLVDSCSREVVEILVGAA